MHSLIERLLKKNKIESIDVLSHEEKETYDKWQKILSEGDITVEKIAEFCKNQLSLIESQWKNLENSEQKNQRLIILHTVYKSIMEVILKPRSEKESLEKYLNSLL